MVVKKLKRGGDRGENTTGAAAESDVCLVYSSMMYALLVAVYLCLCVQVRQCTSQGGGRPVYNAAYLPLSGTICKRQPSTTNPQQIPDEAGAEKDPDEEPHVMCPSPAERESKTSVVCESPKRSPTGRPSVGRSPASCTEISGGEIELSLLSPSPRDSRYVYTFTLDTRLYARRQSQGTHGCGLLWRHSAESTYVICPGSHVYKFF